MCRGPMHDFLAALPKCEHHMHLEGSLEPDLLFELAQRNKISLPRDDPAFESVSSLLARYRRFTSLDDFLHYYFIGMTALVTAADFESLGYAYFRRAHADNVVHAEVFFDPQAHTSRGVSHSTILSGFQAAQTRAKADFNITSELIVCILRHLPAADGHAMYLESLPDLQSGAIRGLGLSGSEKGFHPSLYTETYAHAKAHGIHRTAHAGEEADVSYMAAAVSDLDVQRVDHGIKLPTSPTVMADFVRRGLLVTMCPLSNLELRCVKDIAELPVRVYLDNGVKFSLNSDDPAYFGGYILDNYCAVQTSFGLGVRDWVKIVTDSIEGSWCEEERKAEMKRMLDAVVAGFGSLQ